MLFRSGYRDPATVTSNWRLQAQLHKTDLNAGITLDDADGEVSIVNGDWNGETLTAEGYVKLTTADALGLPFDDIRGPFRIEGDQLTVGTPKWATPPPEHDVQSNAYAGQPLVATIYQGEVHLDAEVLLNGDPGGPPLTRVANREPQWRALARLSHANLEEWASAHHVKERLRGLVDSQLALRGRGNDSLTTMGEGWIQIMPAELYELPILAQVFQQITFRPADSTAFRVAQAEFTVHDAHFDFGKIALLGDSLSLAGQGVVYFAGPNREQVDLKFHSRAKTQRFLPRLFSDNWLQVRVDGTVSHPHAAMQGKIPVEDGLKAFLRTVEAGPLNLPRLVTPPLIRPTSMSRRNP